MDPRRAGQPPRCSPKPPGSGRRSTGSPDEKSLLAHPVDLVARDVPVAGPGRHGGEKTLLTPKGERPVQVVGRVSSPAAARRSTRSATSAARRPRVWRLAGAQLDAADACRSARSRAFALSPDGQTLAVVFDAGASSRLQLLDAKARPCARRRCPPASSPTLRGIRRATKSAFNLAGARVVQRRLLGRRRREPARALDVQRDGRRRIRKRCPTPRSSGGKASTAWRFPACSTVRLPASPVPGR